MKVLQLYIKGIKCDNPDCNYEEVIKYKNGNTNEVIEEYKKWINKPCPKCGQNLLTLKDYIVLKMIILCVDILNTILPEPKNDEGKEVFSLEMNGTGKVKFKPIRGGGEWII
jgi:ssDNA-binding Zn-finger/Zn-ribbon topoisomerase 1